MIQALAAQGADVQERTEEPGLGRKRLFGLCVWGFGFGGHRFRGLQDSKMNSEV